MLLRTHTSSVQTRVMEKQQPPIRIICPGRVYRNEAISYRAHCFFHQVEGLYVDKNVSFADLKQALLFFAKEMFSADTKIRLRPSYFPVSLGAVGRDGHLVQHLRRKRLSVLQRNRLGGDIGMRHGRPECVGKLRHRQAKSIQAMPLGMGIERITNLKYQVKDLRMFSENDIRFLRQFESAN